MSDSKEFCIETVDTDGERRRVSQTEIYDVDGEFFRRFMDFARSRITEYREAADVDPELVAEARTILLEIEHVLDQRETSRLVVSANQIEILEIDRPNDLDARTTNRRWYDIRLASFPRRKFAIHDEDDSVRVVNSDSWDIYLTEEDIELLQRVRSFLINPTRQAIRELVDNVPIE